MSISVVRFLTYPGRRFPIEATLRGEDSDIDGLRTIHDITVEGEGFAQLGTLYLDVTLRAHISEACRRCLTPIDQPFSIHEVFEVPIPPGAESVKVRPAAVELLLSAHDPNVLCRPDCAGLCPTCGVDLNERPGHVCPHEEDRRTLKDLLHHE